MTKIMTITSGMAQVGKTHVAINLALELVRRGRFVGVFHDAVQGGDVSALLDLQALPESQQGDEDDHGVIRQGYQGVDVLACELPLDAWLQRNDSLRSECIGSIDVHDGYDYFLIDTSGMDAHLQLASCCAAAMVILVVTPQAGSQAEAFALLRVLSLNGFSGNLCLLVNKSEHAVDSMQIYDDFSRLVKRHLGLELAYLGNVSEDRLVPLAEQNRQAFSSLFPDAEPTAGIVAAVDVLDDAASREAARQTLPEFLEKLLAAVQTPVCLPGGAQLDTEQAAVTSPKALPEPVAERERNGDLGLLEYAGDVSGLWRFLELLPQALQSLGAALDELVTHRTEQGMAAGQQRSVLILLAELLSLLGDTAPVASVELDVSDTFVTGQQPCWLQSGRYLKYVVRLPPGPLPGAVAALLLKQPGLVNSTGADGEEIYELLDPAHNSCLSVVSSVRTGPRIQVWLPVIGRGELTGLPERQGTRSAEIAGKDLH
jgi:flagellar biosynthesis protein FlhG